MAWLNNELRVTPSGGAKGLRALAPFGLRVEQSYHDSFVIPSTYRERGSSTWTTGHLRWTVSNKLYQTTGLGSAFFLLDGPLKSEFKTM